MKVLCIDVGGSSLKYAVIDQDYTFYQKGKVINTFQNQEQFVEAVKNVYQEYKAEVSGVSLSYCGELNPETGEIYSPGSYPYLAEANLKELLEKALETTVWVEKDGICAGLAEVKRGCLQPYRNSVALTLGTGLGCAILRDGEPYYGSHDMAGLVTVISPARYEMLRKMLVDAVTKIWNGKVLRKENPEGIDGYKFFRKVEKKRPFAVRRLRKFTKALARFIADAQILLDVEAFAIGGGVSAQPRLMEEIQRQVDKQWNKLTIKVTHIKKPLIVTCEFKNDANLIGAMYNFLRREAK